MEVSDGRRDHDGSYCVFVSSRRRHTRFQGDWSSDVCSSDLKAFNGPYDLKERLGHLDAAKIASINPQRLNKIFRQKPALHRSEERRVGKSVDLGGRRIIKKKKRRDISAKDCRK